MSLFNLVRAIDSALTDDTFRSLWAELGDLRRSLRVRMDRAGLLDLHIPTTQSLSHQLEILGNQEYLVNHVRWVEHYAI